MDEHEWETCRNVGAMIGGLEPQVNDRKLRLFAVAACRRLGAAAFTPEARRLIDLSEQFADQEIDHLALVAAAERVEALPPSDANTIALSAAAVRSSSFRMSRERYFQSSLFAAQYLSVAGGAPVNSRQQQRRYWQEVMRQCDFVRDVIGNPFRVIAPDPRWLTSNVTDLARAIYAERAFDRLPILADALMDSGCDDGQVLGHCRSLGPHVRGCWVVDMLLGKT